MVSGQLSNRPVFRSLGRGSRPRPTRQVPISVVFRNGPLLRGRKALTPRLRDRCERVEEYELGDVARAHGRSLIGFALRTLFTGPSSLDGWQLGWSSSPSSEARALSVSSSVPLSGGTPEYYRVVTGGFQGALIPPPPRVRPHARSWPLSGPSSRRRSPTRRTRRTTYLRAQTLAQLERAASLLLLWCYNDLAIRLTYDRPGNCIVPCNRRRAGQGCSRCCGGWRARPWDARSLRQRAPLSSGIDSLNATNDHKGCESPVSTTIRPKPLLLLELFGAALAFGLLAERYLFVLGRGLLPIVLAAVIVTLLAPRSPRPRPTDTWPDHHPRVAAARREGDTELPPARASTGRLRAGGRLIVTFSASRGDAGTVIRPRVGRSRSKVTRTKKVTTTAARTMGRSPRPRTEM